MGNTLASAGLGDALFSSTQQRVLSLLFGQPDRSFFKTEIIRKVGAGSGTVQRELARLEESGFVEGEYSQKIVEGQIIKERNYRVCAEGARALRHTLEFYTARRASFGLGAANAY